MVDLENQGVKRTDLTRVLQEFQAELWKLYGENAPAILPYGSYARGQAHQNSDVDLLLIYSWDIYPGEEIRRVSAILANLNLRYQVLISVLPVVETDFRDSQNIFWKNVRREGIPIESV